MPPPSSPVGPVAELSSIVQPRTVSMPKLSMPPPPEEPGAAEAAVQRPSVIVRPAKAAVVPLPTSKTPEASLPLMITVPPAPDASITSDPPDSESFRVLVSVIVQESVVAL